MAGILCYSPVSLALDGQFHLLCLRKAQLVQFHLFCEMFYALFTLVAAGHVCLRHDRYTRYHGSQWFL